MLEKQSNCHLNIKLQSLWAFLIPLACLLTSTVIFAQDNYNDWSNSARVYINTSVTGANVPKNVYNFPVLLRLDRSSFKGFVSVQPGGTDIRFAKADGTHLAYEIERWTADSAELWVRLDTVFGASDKHYIRMFWGKSEAGDSSKSSEVFNAASGFGGVWHLKEAGNDVAGNYKDATGHSHGTGRSMDLLSLASGPIGNCQRFDGTADYIRLGTVAIHNFPEYSIAMWVKGPLQRDKRIFSESDSTKTNPTFTLGTDRNLSTGKMEAYLVDNSGIVQLEYKSTTKKAFDDSWHHVAWVDKKGVYTMYVDGDSSSSGSYSKNQKALTTTLIGALVNKGVPSYYFAGSIDEVNLSITGRSAEWIKLSYETQKSGGTCVNIPANQTSPSISRHPSDVSVKPGSAAAMVVAASGPPPLTYAWYHGTVSAGNEISKQTADTLSLTNVQLPDTGIYVCVVKNEYGTATSNPGKVTLIGNKPNITMHPEDDTVEAKEPWSMSVTALGDTTLVYSWYKAGNPLPIDSNRVHLVQYAKTSDSGFYYCIIRNAVGECKSRNARLTVLPTTDTVTVRNPIVLRGVYKTATSVELTIGGYRGLPVSTASWYADTVMVWQRTGLFPSGSPSSSNAILKLPISDIQAIPGDMYLAKLIVDSIGSDSYYFKGSVHWRNSRMIPPKDSISPLGDDTSGTAIFMGDTSHPVNTIKVIINSVEDTWVTLRWQRSEPPLIDSVRIWYGKYPIPQYPIPSLNYGLINVSKNNSEAAIKELVDSTRYYFGLQVQRSNIWSIIPDSAKVSVMTLPKFSAQTINNNVRFDSISLDTSVGRLHFTWSIDTANMPLKVGIVWKEKGDTGQFLQPGLQPSKSLILAINDISKPITDSIDIDGTALAFSKEYIFGIWLQKPGTPWSKPTDASTRSFFIPAAPAVSVTCFNDVDSMVSAFNGKVVLKKIAPINIAAKLHSVTPVPVHSGLITMSGYFRFEPQNLVETQLSFGLRYGAIPSGYTVKDIRMYHFDSTNKATDRYWYVDTVPKSDESNRILSIPIIASKDTFPYLLAIDIIPPTMDTLQTDTAVVICGTDIPIKAAVNDNIANPAILLVAGRADSVFKYKASILPSEQYSGTIPGSYVNGDCGMRILLIANDGRLSDTADMSRDMRIPDADTFPSKYEKWIPLTASVSLDNNEIPNVLDEYAQPGMPWDYDIKKFRLFYWSEENWCEYSTESHNGFSFMPGRVIWLKTRKTEHQIILGHGRTVSLKKPYTITLKKNDWTDFALPYRFEVRIGDVLSASDSLVSKKLQFYVWMRDSAERFVTKEFYLPSNDNYNDQKSELTYKQNGERTIYSVFNPLFRDVMLSIPGTAVALSRIPTSQKKCSAGWTIAIRPRTGENEELSPVFCAYRADGCGNEVFPLPPSWGGKVRVGIRDAGSERIYGNIIRNRLVNGGCAFQLVFENNQPSPAKILCTIKRPVDNDMPIWILDHERKTFYRVDSALTVEVGAQSREYRWLATGNQQYIDGLSGELTKTKFGLARLSPNPLRGILRIDYTIPYYGGIESVRCELIDQLGRVVWLAKSGNYLRPGLNSFTWNKPGKSLAAGTYIVRLTGLDGIGKKKEELLSRVMFLP